MFRVNDLHDISISKLIPKYPEDGTTVKIFDLINFISQNTLFGIIGSTHAIKRNIT